MKSKKARNYCLCSTSIVYVVCTTISSNIMNNLSISFFVNQVSIDISHYSVSWYINQRKQLTPGLISYEFSLMISSNDYLTETGVTVKCLQWSVPNHNHIASTCNFFPMMIQIIKYFCTLHILIPGDTKWAISQCKKYVLYVQTKPLLNLF